MDPLSDLLSLLKPDRYRTAAFDAGGEWAVRYDDQVGRIKCYAVTRGGCWLAVDGVAPVRLSAGDCFVLPSGRSFTLASDLGVTPISVRQVHAGLRYGGVVVHQGGGDVYLVGARFDLTGRQSRVLLHSLPPILLIEETADQAALRWVIERLMDEMREERLGSNLAAHHLAHMMLVQALRLCLIAPPHDGIGWFFALADPQIGAAIGAMHADPARRWTLHELATQAGMSRSIFAQRFRDKVGEAPIAYLTHWRMRLAAERLMTGEDTLAHIAQSFGYESENAFNTAFKRVMGCSPRRYARAETAIA
ncbi:cupin domain-containing protein [Dyella acidiphila]|uniref:AraC family transcriptional regulator n=1 Tax=Dyella acidiphila TaxID=2775866 RepID=A0ABR9G8Q5_9GAMM|nr:AraC family transcriptional regulator [Dyella acidiphila]